KRALERLLHSLTSNGNEAKIVELQYLRGSTIHLESFLQRLHHFLPVLTLVHVNEINHDDSPEIAEADLANDFLDGIHVGLDDRVFQTGSLANVLSRVDIDCH